MDTTPTIQTTISAFLASLNSPHTQRAYGTPLRHFLTFLAECGIEAQESAEVLGVDHAIHFVDWLRGHADYERSTVELYLTAVYRFYRRLLLQGLEFSASGMARLEESYRVARDIRGEARPVDHTLDAVRAVIRCARDVAPVPLIPGREASSRRRELVRLRAIALVETLRATGCRVGEVTGLAVGDLDEQTKSALVRGKGSKWRTVYWDEWGWRALQAYLHARAVQSSPTAPLFAGHGNRSQGALSERNADRIVHRLAAQAGVPDVTPHYFRHVFATRALDKTNNLALVQDMLGHASPTTTRVYARTNDEQRRAAHGRVWGQ